MPEIRKPAPAVFSQERIDLDQLNAEHPCSAGVSEIRPPCIHTRELIRYFACKVLLTLVRLVCFLDERIRKLLGRKRRSEGAAPKIPVMNVGRFQMSTPET